MQSPRRQAIRAQAGELLRSRAHLVTATNNPHLSGLIICVGTERRTIMARYEVWLILQEVKDAAENIGTDVWADELQTYQLASCPTEKCGIAVFETAQETLSRLRCA